MDESAGEIPTQYAIARVQRRRLAAVGREEVERAVRPVLVVMAAVDAKDVCEVAAAEDEDPVEAIGAERAYPAFGVG
jgi:HEAT repeat protein